MVAQAISDISPSAMTAMASSEKPVDRTERSLVHSERSAPAIPARRVAGGRTAGVVVSVVTAMVQPSRVAAGIAA